MNIGSVNLLPCRGFSQIEFRLNSEPCSLDRAYTKGRYRMEIKTDDVLISELINVIVKKVAT